MAAAEPVDQVDGRNPFYRPPVVIPAEGRQGSGDGLIGHMMSGLAVPAEWMIRGGKAFQENAQKGEVGRLALDRVEPRIYVKFPWGSPMPLPKAAEAWGGANQVIDKVGAGLEGTGAGILAATGNIRPLFDAGMSRNTEKHAPMLVRPLIDDTVKYDMDKLYGRDEDVAPFR